jgi:hypothetical protein
MLRARASSRAPGDPVAPMTDDRIRRRPMSRIGDLIPPAAARLGLADELRQARAASTFDAIVAELAPAAHGACRAIGIEAGPEGDLLVVEADAPIVAQEVRLNASSLAAAFAAAPAGAVISGLRVTVRRARQSDGGRVR